jgi:hypothetical protein
MSLLELNCPKWQSADAPFTMSKSLDDPGNWRITYASKEDIMSASHNPQGCRVTSPAAITLEYLSEASPEMVADLIYKSKTTDDIRQVMNLLFGRVDWDTRRATSQNTWVDEMLARAEPDPDNVLAKSTNKGRLGRLENRTEHHAERLDELKERMDVLTRLVMRQERIVDRIINAGDGL